MLYNNMWIGERYFQSIFQNYIFNIKLLNFLIITYTSTMSRWLRIMNKIVFWQLKNGIYVTKPHFVTYWVWIIVPHSGTWHAKGGIFTQEDRKFQFQVGCMSFTTLKQNKSFQEKVEKIVLQYLTFERNNQWERWWKMTLPISLNLLCHTRTGSLLYTRYYVFFSFLRKICLY